MSLPLGTRLYCAINDAHCRAKQQAKTQVKKKLHKNVRHMTHALAYHLETLYGAGFVFVLALAFLGNSMFADTTLKMTPNINLSYPLQKVSTFACRQQMKPWHELSEDCKVPLPIIKSARYDLYNTNKEYLNIYTTLWGGSYNSPWDQTKGDHAGTDIASANGTPLYSLAHGIVTFAGTQAGYGNVVKIMFRYQGQTYHAVYAHMKQIDVSKGDMVVQGQKVGEIGNTGSTFGALGGNHLHFEILKDNAGRPAYYYQGCPALQTSTLTQITNGGLCREYREQYSFDPIAFIEASHNSKQPTQIGQAKPSLPEKETIPPIQQPSLDEQVQDETDTQLVLRPIQTAKLTKQALDFLRTWNIEIHHEAVDSLHVGQEASLIFTISKKTTGQAFDGVLPAVFSLISLDEKVELSQGVLQYISKGTATLSYKAKSAGKTNIVISLAGQTLAIHHVNVQ